jgi:hypothetical protein
MSLRGPGWVFQGRNGFGQAIVLDPGQSVRFAMKVPVLSLKPGVLTLWLPMNLYYDTGGKIYTRYFLIDGRADWKPPGQLLDQKTEVTAGETWEADWRYMEHPQPPPAE